MEKLKPCPFCGGKARLFTEFRGITPVAFIRCDKCRVRTADVCASINYTAVETAAEAWNRRADNV